ncbi:hypothetical protein ACYULU_02790 [Breznakiellaceae bacterium SP9]
MNRKPLSYYLALPELAGEHPFMREIHAIRLRIHDETKDMTSAERAAYYAKSHAENEALLKSMGWKGGQ